MARKIPIDFVNEESNKFLRDNTDLLVKKGGGYTEGLIMDTPKLYSAPTSRLDNNSGPFDFYVKFRDNQYEETARNLADHLEKQLKNKYPNEDINVYVQRR